MFGIFFKICSCLFFAAFLNSAIAQTWTAQTPGVATMFCVQFVDLNNGYIGCGLGNYAKTTNSGTSWSSGNIGSTRHIYSLSFIDANTGYAVGYYGIIFKTTNGGTTWISQRTENSNDRLYGVSMTDATTGTIVGRGGLILRTTNGGTNWSTQTSGTTADLSGVNFTDANTGTAVGSNGTIIRTTNGGTTWTTQESGTLYNLSSVSFIDANTGTIVGASGTILKTTNGGANWTAQTSGTVNILKSVCFTDAKHGTIAGFNGTILRTNNGGTTWIAQSTGSSTDQYVGINFTDKDNGTVISSSTCFRSNNASLPVELTSFTASLQKKDIKLWWSTATEVDNAGFEIQRTISPVPSGGGSWTTVAFVEGHGTTNAPQNYSFTDKPGNGKFTYRLKQIDRDGRFDYSQTVETMLDVPNNFTVEQNFPNPFNPSTTISFQIPAKNIVTIKVFDILGKEVSTLLNEEREAGSYKIAFNGASLSSGVYMYQIRSGGDVQTRKFTLMK